MKEKFAMLIEVKKIIALLLCIAFIILSLSGKIETSNFIQVFSLIIAFYFGQSTVKGANK